MRPEEKTRALIDAIAARFDVRLSNQEAETIRRTASTLAGWTKQQSEGRVHAHTPDRASGAIKRVTRVLCSHELHGFWLAEEGDCYAAGLYINDTPMYHSPGEGYLIPRGYI